MGRMPLEVGEEEEKKDREEEEELSLLLTKEEGEDRTQREKRVAF